eukprot:1435305-Ditylum_brightwellii.AAC.1
MKKNSDPDAVNKEEDHTIDLDETLPSEMKGDPNDVLEDLFNDMEMHDDGYQLDVVVDHSFCNGMLILKAHTIIASPQ